MKVLDLINTSESARELLLERCTCLVNAFGIENHVLCSEGPYVSLMRDRGLTVKVLNTPRSLDPISLTSAWTRLLGILRREDYDIIHSHGSVLGLLARLAGPSTRARIVHTVHGFHFHENMGPLKRWPYVMAERMMLRVTDVVLSQNAEDLETLRRWNPRARVEHIGNGIRIPDLPFQYVPRTKARYKLCCIARFEPVKNHEMLLHAFQKVIEEGVDADLVCLGAGPLLPRCVDLAAQLGVADRVTFPGYVDDVFAFLADVDLHLLTSVKEGLPRALIETMAAGIPSVAMDVKGTREVVVSGETGVLLPFGDVEGFAETVASLLRSPDQRASMSKAALGRAIEHYDEEDVCARLFSIYEELV